MKHSSNIVIKLICQSSFARSLLYVLLKSYQISDILMSNTPDKSGMNEYIIYMLIRMNCSSKNVFSLLNVIHILTIVT